MKALKFMRFFLLALILLIFPNCKDREITNPFDSACPKELFTPSDFKAEQQGTAVKLTWMQANSNISGFVISRNENDGIMTEVTRTEKTASLWSDPNIVGGKKYGYQLHAYAGENLSNPLKVFITPVTGATVVTASSATGITPYSAFLGGTITGDGGAAVTERGICYGSAQNPTITNTKLPIGSGTGEFSGTITGLTANTTYYAKAYSTNSQGTTYGAQISFSTPALLLSVTPAIYDVPKENGSRVFTVGSNIDWQVTSDQGWCKPNVNSGKGNGSVIATFETNTSIGKRSAALTFSAVGVSNQIIVLTQAGTEPPALSITPTEQKVTSMSGTTTFAITSNVSWTATSNQIWCTVTSGGSQNSTLIANFTENTSGEIRVATITIKANGLNDKIITLTQRQLLINVALSNSGATATAISSGTYLGITHYPINAIDGDSISYWASQWDMPGWIQVQFKQTYSISRVGIWFGAHKHTFNISLSTDGVNWTTVVPSRLSNNQEGIDPGTHEVFDITPVNAKFIKCNITTTSAPYSHIFQSVLNELEAFGK